MFLCDQWRDYEVLDTGDGEKLERWQDVIVAPPRPAGHLAQTAPRTVDARRRALPPLGTRAAASGSFSKSCPSAGRCRLDESALLRPAHGLQAHRAVSRAGRQLGLDGRSASARGAGPRQGAQPLRLHGRGHGGLRPRRRAGDACGRGQGHGAVGGREPPPERHRRNARALDRRRCQEVCFARGPPRQRLSRASSWTRPATAAAPAARCGSWKTSSTRWWRPCEQVLSGTRCSCSSTATPRAFSRRSSTTCPTMPVARYRGGKVDGGGDRAARDGGRRAALRHDRAVAARCLRSSTRTIT